MTESEKIVFKYFPLRLSRVITSLPEAVLESLTEIRLRRNRPISVTAAGGNLFFDASGAIVELGRAMRLSSDELDEIILRLTDGSIYSFEEFIRCGFIPLKGGLRVGVCGNARTDKRGFIEINSLNIRIPRFIPDAASSLTDYYSKNGLCGAIVVSPPAIGKTTFLRSLAYRLSKGIGVSPCRIGIADERYEICGNADFGLAEIISGLPKAEAVEILTRTMSPEIIILDELSPNECDSVAESVNSGVAVVASAHGKNIEDVIKRGRLGNLVKTGVFGVCVRLGYDGNYYSEIEELT